VTEISDNIKNVIENEPVALFMKGTPEFIMCGNSDRALRALRQVRRRQFHVRRWKFAVEVRPQCAFRPTLTHISSP